MAEKKASTKQADKVLSLDQMREELSQKQVDLIEYKRSHAAGELANPRVITKTRKEIARLHTAIRAAMQSAVKESN